jgi:hypothetical protein
MKTAIYRIPKGVVDLYAERGLDLKDKTVTTRESETDAEVLELVENKDPENRRKLAQSAYDIIVQRRIRDYLESEEAAKLATEEGGLDKVLAEAQKISDEYVYGARKEGTGASTVVRAKTGFADSVLASVDVSDEAKLKRLRNLLGDAAVEGLLAAKKAQDEQAAKKAAGGNGATTPSTEPVTA